MGLADVCNDHPLSPIPSNSTLDAFIVFKMAEGKLPQPLPLRANLVTFHGRAEHRQECERRGISTASVAIFVVSTFLTPPFLLSFHPILHVYSGDLLVNVYTADNGTCLYSYLPHPFSDIYLHCNPFVVV